jgi:hypothetical protein
MKHKKKGKKSCVGGYPSSGMVVNAADLTSAPGVRGQNMDAPDPSGNLSRELLVKTCKRYLTDMHCILWQDWLLEPDKIADDGTVTKKGLTLAAEWLADQIFAVLALTGQTKSPYTSTDATRVQEGATPHG